MRRALIGCLTTAALLSCGEAPPPPPEPETGAAAAGAEKVEFSEIAYAYHGLLLDADRKEIKLDKAVIEGLQDSMLASLTAAPAVEKTAENRLVAEQGPRAALDKAYVDEVLSGFEFTDDERILVKSALIRKAIDAAPAQERLAYQWRFDLLHERSQHYLRPKFRELRPEFVRYLSSLEDLLELLRRLLDALFPTAYISDCRANSVPIPPDWPSGWTNSGDLPFALNFLESGPDTEVWTYEDPGGLGLCYALPRQEAGYISLVGIICQSESTGKACFWDNIDAATGRRIEGVGITLRINGLKDGSNLAENCTECHRGYNAFLVHPTTPLGAPADRDPAVRYSPIGQAGWSNPPAFATVGSGACAGCHQLAALNPSICAILELAAEKTMPDPADPAGWANPDPPYAAHITAIQTACAGGRPPRPCPDDQQCCGNEQPDGSCDGQCWPSGDPCP